MRAADLGLTLAFTVEAGLKVLALGPKRYARDSWNALDVVVLALAYGEMLATAAGAELSGLSAFKAVRAMRALRPLRAVRRLPGLRIVVETLLSCVPDVLSVVSVLALVVLVFALFALTYLKGALNHCAGDAFDSVIAPDAGGRLRLLEEPRAWGALDAAERAWFGANDTLVAAAGGAARCLSLIHI